MEPVINDGSGWLSDADWAMVQKAVPIVCVDVLPTRTTRRGGSEIGLIYRQTPHQGFRWCLVGGRLLRNEPLESAKLRQLRVTLGSDVVCVSNGQMQPIFVAEYFTQAKGGSPSDPRQHAIGLVFRADIRGSVTPMGEALEFRWFDVAHLPDDDGIGFGQGQVLRAIMSGVGRENMD